MSKEEILYRVKTAGAEDIYVHLNACKDEFIPSLDQTVDIRAYSEKISGYAVTFEAWNDHKLAGLIAAYFNDDVNRIGFITNVSILPESKGKGIASELVSQCVEFAMEHRFNNISLEVNKNNLAAINLYRKYNFENSAEEGDTIKMLLYLQETNNKEI